MCFLERSILKAGVPPHCVIIFELSPSRTVAEGVGETTLWWGGTIACTDSSDEGLKELRKETGVSEVSRIVRVCVEANQFIFDDLTALDVCLFIPVCAFCFIFHHHRHPRMCHRF